MSPNANQMRKEVGKLYPGPDWKRRVSRMSDEQITAIYLRDKPEKRKNTAAENQKEDRNGGQIKLF